MRSALIGYTGFVGGNLSRRAHFDDLFNSSNIDAIAGRHYSLIVCAGAPAAKWKANQAPAADLANLNHLMESLRRANAHRLVLISTVDVYAKPVEVDEDSEIDLGAAPPYGRHRRLLELFVEDHFNATVVRLPGLFGQGLKKNVIFDLANDHQVERICRNSVFQFYPVVNLWDDLAILERERLSLVNFATEPMSVERIATEVFGFDLSRLRSEHSVS